MTVPANLITYLVGSEGLLSLTISLPGANSTIPNNSTPETISGVAISTAGNVTVIRYRIDSGAWANFSFSPSSTVNYSGGNAGQVGVGMHTVTVEATDAALNVVTVSNPYSILTPPPPSISWTPSAVYSGQSTTLTIISEAPLAAVTYTQQQYNAQNALVSSGGPTSLGSTNSLGNLTVSNPTSWTATAWYDNVQLFIGGVNIANFQFTNFGVGPTYSYGPSVAPNGTTVTLNISNSWGSSTVSQITTFYPSGRVAPSSGSQVLGATSASGNFTYSSTSAWGAGETSCVVNVYLDNLSVASFGFTP